MLGTNVVSRFTHESGGSQLVTVSREPPSRNNRQVERGCSLSLPLLLMISPSIYPIRPSFTLSLSHPFIQVASASCHGSGFVNLSLSLSLSLSFSLCFELQLLHLVSLLIIIIIIIMTK